MQTNSKNTTFKPGDIVVSKSSKNVFIVTEVYEHGDIVVRRHPKYCEAWNRMQKWEKEARAQWFSNRVYKYNEQMSLF